MKKHSKKNNVPEKGDFQSLSLQIRRLCMQIGICMGLIIVLAFAVLMAGFGFGANNHYVEFPDDVYYMDYNVNNLPFSGKNEEIKLGFDIFRNTSLHIGPKQKDSSKAFARNNLACASCHLNGGTKPYAAPLIGVVKRFPQFRGRENKMGTIEERINGCMERSMNGRTMPESSVEMQALIAYMDWLGRAAPSNGKIEGQGFLKVEIPNRAVDLVHGQRVFENTCVECHGADGQGQLLAENDQYLYPPLWGGDSYNNGAGMTRVITAAQFIKGNMPFGVTFDNPILTDEEAYDVAGYINQKLRPTKPNRAADFPDLVKKPVSTPYGPYLDPFSEEQHQLGPFQPIMEYYQKEYQLSKSK
ncbi:c-type cytochrome [Flagellimonas halotolerans]|uniref:C-type cytochrome n=1 Tax=Flagellimonas halotolerans TaxID=3112164 RepID=A0ABU6IMK0_9FLAO|nr:MULTISPECIES: c-type cytochrome [unclassified Allomuricauda]MEC3964423.1 c-type cytochrome [Muricauda sp. SYSU M86414]MEC4264293.1 c-type cytochrome [Muricauda sp. SYSU M84420]